MTVPSVQKTIAKEGSVSGIGIHTGAPSRVAVKPAPAGFGIQFFKNGSKIETAPERTEGARCTSVGEGKNQIQTVEHLLATLAGLGITNILIDVDGPEIPALDGSAEPFVKLFKGLGILDQKEEKEVFKVREPIFCCENGKAISIYPADEFSISYTLDYDHPRLKNQKVDFTLTPELFEKEIAPARTFCTEKEGTQLRKSGLGLGASLENTLVISDNGAPHQALRFPDECARHKVLDILGDMNLLGFSVLGRVVGLRSGHSLNRKLMKAISAQREDSSSRNVGGLGNGNQQRGVMNTKKDGPFSKQLPMELEQIKKILPHRYPFLLVDRILEMSDKKIVAIKNVSGSEPFFQGHFPGKPVMPGVLMIEALAQAGGTLILSKSEYHGKLAYLVAVNNARFRRTVVPGDQLRLEVELMKIKGKISVIQGVAKVGAEEACSAEIMFALAD